MPEKLARYVKDRRAELRYPLSLVAKHAGLSKAAVNFIERDEVPNPTIKTLHGLSKALHVPLETLARLAAGDELSRPGLEREVAAIICDLPPSDQLEILTTIETLAAARRKRLGL